jgi:peptide/nickel transport system permease protein
LINYLIRRLFVILAMALIVSFVSFVLLSIAPGGPLQEIFAMQSLSTRLDPDLIERTMKRYDLDLYLIPRYLRWLTGHPRGPLEINGQSYFGDLQVGCLKEGRARLVYPDGRVVEIDCEKPVFLRDLVGRPVSNGILALDFGKSTQILREQPVMRLFESRLGNTLLLMGISTFLSIAIAVPLGILSAVKQYSRFDYIFTTLAFIGSGMPTLFMGIIGILIFAILFKELGLPYLPAGTAISARDTVVPLFGTIKAGSFVDRLWHLVLPVAILTIFNLASWSRFIRSSMLEVLRQDYVRTARAKGLIERLGGRKARHAQRADPVRHAAGRCAASIVRRRDHHRERVQLPRHGPAVYRRPHRRRLQRRNCLYLDLDLPGADRLSDVGHALYSG